MSNKIISARISSVNVTKSVGNYQIFKNEGLAESQVLERGCWERGRDLSAGEMRGLPFLHK